MQTTNENEYERYLGLSVMVRHSQKSCTAVAWHDLCFFKIIGIQITLSYYCNYSIINVKKWSYDGTY